MIGDLEYQYFSENMTKIYDIPTLSLQLKLKFWKYELLFSSQNISTITCLNVTSNTFLLLYNLRSILHLHVRFVYLQTTTLPLALESVIFSKSQVKKWCLPPRRPSCYIKRNQKLWPNPYIAYSCLLLSSLGHMFSHFASLHSGLCKFLMI